MIGIELTYTDGEKDWYDPVKEIEFESMQTDSEYIIDNGFHIYKVPKSKVTNVRKYDLCSTCQYEVGTCQHTEV